MSKVVHKKGKNSIFFPLTQDENLMPDKNEQIKIGHRFILQNFRKIQKGCKFNKVSLIKFYV